jgi:hypothetical protein
LHGDQNIQLNVNGNPVNSIINSIGDPQATKTALVPGDELDIHVSSPINPTFWAFLGFLVLLIILIPLSLWRRPAKETEAGKIEEPVLQQSVYGRTSESTGPSNQWLQEPAAVQLIEQIAALDEVHAAGQMDEEEYRHKRDALKGALLQLAPGTF